MTALSGNTGMDVFDDILKEERVKRGKLFFLFVLCLFKHYKGVNCGRMPLDEHDYKLVR